MVDPEHAASQSRPLRNQPASLRREVARASVTERPGGLEALEVRGAHTAGDPVQFRIVPGDRETDCRVQKCAEVVRIVRVFPEVVGVDQYVSPNGLLKSGVELIAKAWLDRHRSRSKHVLGEPANPCRV